jgi:hypothetical protein
MEERETSEDLRRKVQASEADLLVAEEQAGTKVRTNAQKPILDM